MMPPYYIYECEWTIDLYLHVVGLRASWICHTICHCDITFRLVAHDVLERINE